MGLPYTREGPTGPRQGDCRGSVFQGRQAGKAEDRRPHMPDEETIARYLRHAAELLAAADQTEDHLKRDALIAAAKAYEELASWVPAETAKRE